jgi:hypothetical protein
VIRAIRGSSFQSANFLTVSNKQSRLAPMIRNIFSWSQRSTANESLGPPEPSVQSQPSGHSIMQRLRDRTESLCCQFPRVICPASGVCHRDQSPTLIVWRSGPLTGVDKQGPISSIGAFFCSPRTSEPLRDKCTPPGNLHHFNRDTCTSKRKISRPADPTRHPQVFPSISWPRGLAHSFPKALFPFPRPLAAISLNP